MGENLKSHPNGVSDDKYFKRSIMSRQLGYSTLLSFSMGFFGLLGVYQLSDHQVATAAFFGLLLLHVVITFVTGKVILPRNLVEWFIASGLGVSTAVGIITFFKSTSCFAFGSYVFVMSLFHFGEYFATALTNPSNLSVDSFLLNHGLEYTLAAVASWTEFFLELWLFPKLKTILPMTVVGVMICILGDLLRKSAMFKAGESFSHIVQSTKKESHKLVVSGVYSMMRHPSYVGWFYWSVGTQITLCNPVCFVLYAFVSWKFFHERVFIEEQTLLSFFGDDYLNYQKAVPVGIPGISGFVVNTDL